MTCELNAQQADLFPTFFHHQQALATLREKLRKYNKDFEQEILKYREVSFYEQCCCSILYVQVGPYCGSLLL